jgi:hypothetical protein
MGDACYRSASSREALVMKVQQGLGSARDDTNDILL